MTTGTMETLDRTGDTKVMWDRHNEAEVKAAKAMFQSLREKHYLAFKAIGKDGAQGSQIDAFDPDLERIIMVPRMVGG